MATPDLTRDQVESLVALTNEVDVIERRLAPDLLTLKESRKKIDAMVATARASLIEAGKPERKRFGVLFRLVEKSGTVAWKGLCESLKGKEWCEQQSANATRKTDCVYEVR